MHSIVDVSNLSDREKEMIRAAVANQGVLEVVMRSDTRGRAVCAGRKKFFDRDDRNVAQQYIALLSHLRELELICEVDSKNRYELTNFGWEISRRLPR
jgi:hypothetical protein